MVFKPLYQPLWILKRQFQGEVIPFDILNTITRMVLMGLDYLHTQSHIVHTGRFKIRRTLAHSNF